MKVLSSDYGDCVLARKEPYTFDNQAGMSKQGDSPDYECWRQLWECQRHVTTDLLSYIVKYTGEYILWKQNLSF